MGYHQCSVHLSRTVLSEYQSEEREQSVSFEDLTVEHLDEVNKVVEKYLAGNEPTQISKELAMPRQKVVAYINEWRSMAADNAAIRARAKEALVGADTHYTKLIQKAYEVIDDATTTAALRGQATDITASSSGGVLTVTALTTAPASGDTFTIT